MLNLNTYRKELLSSICLIYFKLCVMTEYYSIFKNISNFEFSTNIFHKQLTAILKQKYLPKFSERIKDKFIIDYDSLILKSINEILLVINSLDNNKFSLQNFPLMLNIFHVEKLNDVFYEPLNKEKYISKSFYIEKYLRIVDKVLPTITEPLLQNRAMFDKGVVNIRKFKEFLETRDHHTNEQFFSIIDDILLGVRLIYLPEITNVNKQLLYNQLQSDQKVQLDKINAIKGRFDENEEINYFFPLKICHSEVSIFENANKTKEYAISYINNQIPESNGSGQIQLRLLSLSEVENFKKLFNYHIPIQSFEVLYPTEQLLYNDLVKKVYDRNLPFNNLNIIFNLVEKIANAEDPTKL